MENEELRVRLLAAAARSPGEGTARLAREVGISASTADYHLRRLAKAGDLTTLMTGRTRRWYAGSGRLCPVLKRAIPELRRPEARAFMAVMDETPTTAPAIAERAGMPEGTVRWVSAVMHASFLITKSRHGRVCLREGAERCLAQALAGASCPEWGRCVVSAAWERERGSR